MAREMFGEQFIDFEGCAVGLSYFIYRVCFFCSFAEKIRFIIEDGYYFVCSYNSVSICRRFFEIILNPKSSELIDLLTDIITDRPFSRNYEESSSDEVFYDDQDDLILRTPNTEATSVCLVETIAFLNISLEFEAHLRHLRIAGINSAEDSSRLILCDRLMTNISRELFDMRMRLGRLWKESGAIKLDHVEHIVRDGDLRMIVEFLKLDLINLVDLAVPREFREDELTRSCETIYGKSDVVESFAINPV